MFSMHGSISRHWQVHVALQVVCTAGKFSTKPGAKSSTACEDCVAGQYSANPGETECIKCTQGKFAKKNGLTNCTSCPDGLISHPSIGGTECINCMGKPIYLARGHCSTVTGACVCNKDTRNGWQGPKCSLCNLNLFVLGNDQCT